MAASRTASPTASLLAANVNPSTGLATDYLNHFNEITMLIGLVADMPEVIDDCRAWAPLGYVEHFERSGFAGRRVAVAAYRACDPVRRVRFEAVVAAIDAEILSAVSALGHAPSADLGPIAEAAGRRIDPLVAAASALIHGVEAETGPFEPDTAQHCVDVLFA